MKMENYALLAFPSRVLFTCYKHTRSIANCVLGLYAAGYIFVLPGHWCSRQIDQSCVTWSSAMSGGLRQAVAG